MGRAGGRCRHIPGEFLPDNREKFRLSLENWRRKYAALFAASFSAKNITEFFEELRSRPNWEADFFKVRLERLDEDEVFSFDATNIATEALQTENARDGKGKKTRIRRQVNMALAFGHKCGLPVLFRVFTGNILDVSTISELFFRFKHLGGVHVSATVPDRGYFSKDNLVRFLRSGYNCLMAAKTNVSWVADAHRRGASEPWKPSLPLVQFDFGKDRPGWLGARSHGLAQGLGARVPRSLSCDLRGGGAL